MTLAPGGSYPAMRRKQARSRHRPLWPVQRTTQARSGTGGSGMFAGSPAKPFIFFGKLITPAGSITLSGTPQKAAKADKPQKAA